MIELIQNKAREFGIDMKCEQAEKFAAYHEMLVERNKVMNLTAVSDDVEEAIDRNYLDCISILKTDALRDIKTIIDVGSGAGFPGIPLSIMCPDIHFTLMDALNKRIGFLNEVIEKLGLNATAVHYRAEDGARKPEFRESFDAATARAVAEVNLLSEYMMPFIKTGGKMILYKGPGLTDELERAQNALDILQGSVESVHDIRIPGREWEHTICVIRKTGAVPEKYPRRAGKPEKKPL